MLPAAPTSRDHRGSPCPTPPRAAAAAAPPLVVNAQYVKDLSFEVPNAPEVFSTLRAQPNVNINLDVQARRLQDGQDVFEVTLQIKAEAVEPPAARPMAARRRAASRCSSPNWPTAACSR